MRTLRTYFFLLISLGIYLTAPALSSTAYSNSSRLVKGKWVKIAVTQSGMHQLSFEQLAEMGFSDPNKVRIFGKGGAILPELLDGSAPDDLQPVAIGLSDDKIYFYAVGPVTMSLNTNKSAPAYTRTLNHYANKGYYFLTESDADANYIKYYSTASTGGIYPRKTSLDYAYHEQETIAFTNAGRDLFGEDIASASADKPANFDYTLISQAEDTPITLQCAIAAKTSATTNVACKFNNEDVTFASNATTISPVSGFESYKVISPSASFTPLNTSSRGKLSIGFSDQSSVQNACLDYFVITYFHDNIMDGAQMFMGYNDLSEYDKVSICDDRSTLQVWNVTDKYSPTRMALYSRTETNEEYDIDETFQEFSYGKSGIGEFVAFDPTEQLYEIDSYEPISNQNIHGEKTPDYVIICPKQLTKQAERLAQLHRDNDGIQVLVVEQEKVFNEFSSGTPDATAYRLMMKMFYDRDPQKLKYLLMFGGGYFDNRQLTRKKGDNYLLTYQSVIGNNNALTYVSDDYFGLLTDNSGINITSDKLCVGVGRLPVITESEADDIVSKIEAYMHNSDFTNWRNKVLIMDEFGDDDIHTYQSNGIEKLIATTTAKDFDVKRLHIAAYTLPGSDGFAKGANNTYAATLQLADFLKEGILFMTYMGHGGPTSLSKNTVWTTGNVKDTPMPRLPIMSLAACDIANYDSNTRGIGEYMITTPDHGCIALLTSTRTVEATENDQLNRAFIKALFTLNDNGSERTLGEAYLAAKLSYGSTPSRNKMCYTLFADPALMPSYPKSYIKVNTLNGNDASNATILKPMTYATIDGTVCNADGSKIDDFTGTVTASLYDTETLFKKVSYDGDNVNIYHNRPLLAEATANVENGKFSVKILVPKSCTANGSNGLIKIYANSRDNKLLENASIKSISFAEYDENDEATIVDNQAPVVEKMYINDEQTFANDMNVAPDFTLHALITDDNALSNQSQTIGKQISLLLDGVTQYDEIRGYATPGDNGASLSIAMPLTAISEGQHTAKITAYDAAGNSVSKEISFIVVPSSIDASITADTDIATDKVTFSISHNFAASPSTKIYVMNARNEVVWSNTTSEATCEWNLTDAAGNRLPAGVYNYFGTLHTDNQSTGTKISKITILEN